MTTSSKKPSVDEIWSSLKASTARKARDALAEVKASKAKIDLDAAAPSPARRDGDAAGTDDEDAGGPMRSLTEASPFTVQGIMASVRRDVNCLSDAERQRRKLGADRLRQRLLEDAAFSSKAAGSLLDDVLSDAGLLVPMCRLLSDPAEKCRVASLRFVGGSAEAAGDTRTLLTRALPEIHARIGGDAVLEPSEEVRLSLVRLLRGPLLKKSGQAPEGFAGEIAAIALKGLEDPFHEVKKEACGLIADAVATIPRDALEPKVR